MSKDYMQSPQTEESGAFEEPKEIQRGGKQGPEKVSPGRPYCRMRTLF